MPSQRSLRGCSFLFILFSLFCSMAVISTVLSSSSLIHFLCQLFCNWFLLVYFSFQLLYYSSLFVLSSSRSPLIISCIFLICASILFWDLGSSLLSLLWILFQVDCLSPLQLVIFVGFYLVPSFATYFSVISFCLIYCVCDLLSTGCRIIVPLASGVCSLVAEVVPDACAIISLIGGLTGVVVTKACPEYWVGSPLWSLVVTSMSLVGSAP